MDEIETLAETFKTLADPTRLRLIKLLLDHQGALCVNALANQLEVTQSAVSQHLRVLRQAGWVQGDRRGHRVHYSLNPQALAEHKTLLQQTLGDNFVLIA